MSEQFIKNEPDWREWWGKVFRRVAPNLENSKTRMHIPDEDFIPLQECCWNWWRLRFKQPAAHLNFYWSPYLVIMLYLLIIGISQFFTATRHSYLSYWDTLTAPMELRWLIPIMFGFPLGFFGLWHAHHRSKQTSDQINLQIRSQNQQRFFDAVKLIDAETESVQLAGLEALRIAAQVDDFRYHSEASTLLVDYLEQHITEASWEAVSLGIANGEQGPSKLAEHAFRALASLGSGLDQDGQKSTSKRSIVGAGLAGISVEFEMTFQHGKPSFRRQARFESLHFKGCDLRGCGFAGAILSNVAFTGNSLPPLNTDLTNASFLFAELNSVGFGTSNISGVEFGNTKGLNRIALLGCVYDFFNPPKNLPINFILRHPSFKFVEIPKGSGIQRIEPLNSSCIKEFCEKHPNFRPHNHGSVITV